MTSTLTGEPGTEARGRRRKLVIGGSVLAAVLVVGTPIALKLRGSDDKPPANTGAAASDTGPAVEAQPAPPPDDGGGIEAAKGSAAPEVSPVLVPRKDAEVFWRAAGDHLGHASLTNTGSWKGLESTGSGVATPPSAVYAGELVHVFWKGTDQQLWTRRFSQASGWQGEATSLKMGKVGGAPRAVAGPDGSINVFWWGVDGQLWNTATSDGSSWRGPTQLGGKLASDPSPVTSSAG